MAQKTAESKSGLAISRPNCHYGSHCAKWKLRGEGRLKINI
jgi:hypothetical protein